MRLPILNTAEPDIEIHPVGRERVAILHPITI